MDSCPQIPPEPSLSHFEPYWVSLVFKSWLAEIQSAAEGLQRVDECSRKALSHLFRDSLVREVVRDIPEEDWPAQT